jgi:acyl-ACP thioesterase
MRNPASDLVWTDEFPVRLYEADSGGSLAVGSLCNYLQEAAGNHAGHLGVSVGQLMERGLTWVLARFRVRIDRRPAAGETVAVRTWPTGAEKLFALRDFQACDARGNQVASAMSAWLIIDTSTRRPVRIQSVFDPPEASETPRALEIGTEKLPALENSDRESPVIVRLSDLDSNAHANNARIAEWIVEGVGREAWVRNMIHGLDIDFVAEAMQGDTLASRAAALPAGQFLHSLVRNADGREIARARTLWEPRRSQS